MENPNKFFGQLNIRKQGKEGKKLGREREREVEREDTFSKFAAREEEKQASETFHETDVKIRTFIRTRIILIADKETYKDTQHSRTAHCKPGLQQWENQMKTEAGKK